VTSDELVLAVDDEPANQRAIRRTLGEDCRVLTAGSGVDALELMEQHPVALVIADQRMPGMTGAELLAEIAARHPTVIRVVLTGYTDVDTLLEAINRGHVYHFLSKPWEARELRQVVRRGLDRFIANAERNRLLEELQATCRRVQHEAEQKTRLLTLAAHELGTPLHILINATALLRDGQGDIAPRWLDAIDRAVEWLTRGITQLHDAARSREQRIRIRPERIAAAPLLERAIGAVRAAARERQLAFSVTADEGALWADPLWVEHALASLLSNAVRCTADGGAIAIAAATADGMTTIAVRDTGTGIAAEHLPDLFEPFSAAGGDVLLHGSGLWAFGARGLGLGLALVKSIAEAHGGAVTVESAPGAGSCFTLHLPHVASGAVAPSA